MRMPLQTQSTLMSITNPCWEDIAANARAGHRPQRTSTPRGIRGRLAPIALAITGGMVLATLAPATRAQGSRKDDIVFGPDGHPVAGATVRVCQATATGTPCSPLATVYTDATLTATSANPFQTDGIGNYHFYAPAGRYLLQISSPQINGTLTYPDVILPSDVSSSGAGNDISAFGLTLGGNLSVAGNATVSGTLTTSNFNPGAFTPSTLEVSGNGCFGGPRPYIDVTCPAYGARGDGGGLGTTGSISAGSNQLTVASASGWVVNNGLVIAGADATGNQLAAQITAITGSVFTLNVTAGTTVSGAAVADDDYYPVEEAINAACASTIAPSQTPDVFFPPGSYAIAQTQGSSTTPVLPNCFGLKMSGSETGSSLLIVHHPGTNPSPGPLFSVPLNGNLSHLSFDGYNESLLISGVAAVGLDHVSAGFNSPPTGMTDNTAVKIAGSFEVHWHHGTISSNSQSVPNMIVTDNGAGVPSYLLDFEDISLGPGGDIFSARSNCITLADNYIFKNLVREGADTDFFTFNTPSSNGCSYTGFIFDQIQDADDTVNTPVFINFDQPNGYLTGARISYVSPPSGIEFENTASLRPPENIDIKGGFEIPNTVVDASGNPIGNGITIEELNGGKDHIIAGSNQQPVAAPFSTAYSLSDRWFENGSGYSTLASDPYFGEMFGDGTIAGYTARLRMSTPEALDVGFAQLLPPTSFTGTATTGGSLAANTYYAILFSTTSTSSCNSVTASTFAYALPLL